MWMVVVGETQRRKIMEGGSPFFGLSSSVTLGVNLYPEKGDPPNQASISGKLF
jgi:hypothetical protein